MDDNNGDLLYRLQHYKEELLDASMYAQKMINIIKEVDITNDKTDTSKVTRVEVIDENGRSYVKRGCTVDVSIQDE